MAKEKAPSVEEAQAGLEREQARLVEARAALADLDAQCAELDPDDRAFGGADSKRAACAARIRALEAREQAAAEALAEAQERARLAAREAARKELAKMDAEIAKVDAAGLAEILAMRERIAGLAAEQRARIAERDARARAVDPRGARAQSFLANIRPGAEFRDVYSHPQIHSVAERARLVG